MSGPLEGLRVLDLTRLQPGNYATTLMGDLGAEVIKIEEPGTGDYVRWTPPMVGSMSAAHLALNRNKKSVTLNLKAEAGKELLFGLVQTADVLVESYRPGVMTRLGVGYEQLIERKSDLIYAAITGYGQDGPYRDRAGHDINYVAISGVLGTTGEEGGPPVLPSVQVADLAGAMMAVIGVLAALHRRGVSGVGEFIDVSMMDSSLSWLALHLAPWLAGGPRLERGTGYLNGGYPFYRVYRCADDKYISVGALEHKFWKSLCLAVDLPELVDEQLAQGKRRQEIHQILEDLFATKSRDEWVRILGHLETCVGPVNDFDEMSRDLQVLSRKMLVERELPGGGTWRDLGVPIHLTNSPGSIRTSAPELGQHNEEVYAALGLSSDDLVGLREEGAI